MSVRAESLEMRRLLSVQVTDHRLLVCGTPGDDTIILRRSDPVADSSGLDAGLLILDINGATYSAPYRRMRRIVVSGRGGNDLIRLDGMYADSADDLSADTLVGVRASITGGAGADTIVGGTANDTINGGAGADSINAGAGEDLLIGGLGRDRILGGSGEDSICGNRGDDSLYGDEGTDVLSGGRGNDRLTGGESSDYFRGGKGFDTAVYWASRPYFSMSRIEFQCVEGVLVFPPFPPFPPSPPFPFFPYTGDEYEPDDQPDNATDITINGPAQTHSIDTFGDVDWVHFDLDARSTLTIRAAANVDTIIRLYSASDLNNRIAVGYSQVEYSSQNPLRAGCYYALISGRFGQIVDSYELSVTASPAADGADQYEADGDPENASALSTRGEIQTHSISPAGDLDWVHFQLDTSSTVHVLANASSETFLRLYSESDLEHSIASGLGIISSEANPFPAGEYFVRIGSPDGSEIPSYELSVTASPALPADEYEWDDSAENARAISIDGQVQTHSISTPSDIDWIYFELDGPSALSILASNPDTALWLYSASDLGQHIQFNYSQITYSMDDSLSAGEYFVCIASPGGSEIWSYELSVTASPAVTADSYEPDDTMNDASAIPTDGSPQTHTITPGDQDFVSFTLDARSEVTIETAGTGDGTSIVLYAWDDDGSIVVTGGTSDVYSSIRRQGTESLDAGTYFVQVNGSFDTSSCYYTLSVLSTVVLVGPLVETDAFASTGSADQIVFSAEHGLVFLRNSGSAIRVIDTATHQQISLQMACRTFTDMSLTPDGNYLYAADFGGERTGYGIPVQPSSIQRYNLQTRAWDTPRQIGGIAYRIEAVDDEHFLLLTSDQWVGLSLLRWEDNEPTVSVLDTIGSDYYGDIEFDPATGRVFHGNSGSSSHEINVARVLADDLVSAEGTGTYGSAQSAGGTSVLSTDRQWFYYGRLQVEALDVTHNMRVFEEPILASTGQYAFGTSAYYDASTGLQAGTLMIASGVYGVDRSGQNLFVYDPANNTLRRFSAA